MKLTDRLPPNHASTRSRQLSLFDNGDAYAPIDKCDSRAPCLMPGQKAAPPQSRADADTADCTAHQEKTASTVCMCIAYHMRSANGTMPEHQLSSGG